MTIRINIRHFILGGRNVLPNRHPGEGFFGNLFSKYAGNIGFIVLIFKLQFGNLASRIITEW